MKLCHTIAVDTHLLSQALNIPAKRLVELFRENGRLTSFLFAPRVAELMHMMEIKEENGPAGVVDKDYNRYMIRTLTRQSGVNFAPQLMRGVGRFFDQERFEDHLEVYKGYIIIDANSFPFMDIYLVEQNELKKFMDDDELNNGAMTYSSFHHKANGGIGLLL